MKKKRFYTDGIKTIKLSEDDEIPDGFYPGRTFNSKPWNKGLTKETDERVRLNALGTQRTLKEKHPIPWNKNLTKEDNESLRIASEKISKKMKGNVPWNKGLPVSEERKRKQSQSMKGHIAWNKGLTKETNESLLSTSNSLKGHECFVKDWEKAKEKEYQTKKLNNSFNKSSLEESFLKELLQEYEKDDIVHPYRDDRYPFNCDFYIKSKDLFIELNGTIEHNLRPFEPDNKEHLLEAESIKSKAIEKGPKSRYWNIYRWWTEIDPKKLQTFRENNLNFKIIYPNNLIIDN